MRLQRISADHEEVRTDQRDKPRFDSDLSNLLSRLAPKYLPLPRGGTLEALNLGGARAALTLLGTQ